MANPQLTSYVKQQLGLGDNESSIKSNLRSVGWPEVDIADAFKEASPVAAAPVAQKPASPVMPSSPSPVAPVASPMASPQPASPAMPSSPMPASPSPVSPAMPKTAAPAEPRKINLEAFAPMSSPSPITRPFSASPAVMSFTAQKPMESIFQPQAANPAPVQNANPSPAASPLTVMPISSSAPKKSWGSIAAIVIMLLIIVGMGALSWMLYQNNSMLKAQVMSITTQLNTLSGQQTVNSQSLASQIAALQDDNKDLDSQLALFTPRSTTSTVTVTLKGTIGGGGKLNYTLTTSRGIVVNIKNSKDPKIVAALSPLVGIIATLTGTQTPGAKEITVTQVNGVEPSLPAVATSTPPSAIPTASTTP